MSDYDTSALKRRRTRSASPRQGGGDVTAAQCVVCKTVVAQEDKEEHPWLYGATCPACLSTCKNVVLNWSAGSSLQCEKCTSVRCLTIYKLRILCYNCVGKVNIRSLPKPRHDFEERLVLSQLQEKTFLKEKKALRVLSMFDGIGTGLLVLDALGLEVEEYFSCEIDDTAIALLDYHYFGRIKHLGSVSNLSSPKLKSLGPIDLVLGGSPCNQLSLANPTRKGLYDPAESGVLFFDFNRVLKGLQADAVSRGNTLYWLYENVAAMPHNFRDTISKTLQCKPAKWDGIQFLPAKRARFFWGNIPELHSLQETDRPPLSLNEILEPYRKAVVQTLPTLTTTFHSQTTGKEMQLPVIEDGNESGLLITERERLFGFPTHYTDGPDISITKRQGLLGRAWSVPVIKKILSPLTRMYKMRNA